MLRNVVIVGASLAGLRAAETLRNDGFDGTVTLVNGEAHLPYDRPPLSKRLLAGELEHRRHPARARKPDYEPLDLDIRFGRLATALDTAAQTRHARRRRVVALRRPDPRDRRHAAADPRHTRPRRHLRAAHARRLARGPRRARQDAEPRRRRRAPASSAPRLRPPRASVGSRSRSSRRCRCRSCARSATTWARRARPSTPTTASRCARAPASTRSRGHVVSSACG